MRQRSPMRCLSWRSSGRSSLAAQLGLADEQDLQDLLARRLEVGEQPDLLEGLRIEVLGLVEDQDRVLAGALALDQEVLEREEPLGQRASPGLAMPRSSSMYSRSPVEAEHRVGDERHRRRLVQPLEQRLEQRRLARADLAGQQDEALALLDPVEELGERLLVRRRQVEEAGIRRRIERRLPQPKKARSMVMARQARSRSEHADELLVAVGDEVGGADDQGQAQQRPAPRPAGSAVAAAARSASVTIRGMLDEDRHRR